MSGIKYWIHKRVAHPLQSFLMMIAKDKSNSYFSHWKRYAFWIHDKNLPDLPAHLWSDPPFGHPKLNAIMVHSYPERFRN